MAPQNPDHPESQDELQPSGLAPGQILLDRYAVISFIGRGGMGEVWLVEDKQLRVRRAIKVLPPEMVNDERALKNLRKEAKLTSRLDHPGIVRLRTIEAYSEGRAFLVYDHVPGLQIEDKTVQDLSQLLKLRGRIEEADLWPMLPPILEALHCAHSFRDEWVPNGIVHRDLKPSNILLEADGVPKIGDFSIARLIQANMSRITRKGPASGTRYYMSPEQVQGLSSDARSDIYNLGIMLYELLTGQPPFIEGDVQKYHLHEPVPIIQRVSREMNAFIQKAVAKVPASRWQTCEEMRVAALAMRKAVEEGAPEAPAAASADADDFEERSSDHDLCPTCGNPGDPPYLLCRNCGAPRLKLNRWIVLANISLASTAFLGTFYFLDALEWPWPIFALYCLMFVQFSISLAVGRWRLAGRIVLWCVAFFAVAGGIGFLINWDGAGPGYIILALADSGLPDYAMENPFVFYPALGALLALYAIPIYFRWRRVYGLVNAYRIVLLSLLAIAVAGLIALKTVQWLHAANVFPDWEKELRQFIANDMIDYRRALRSFGVNVFRIFLVEVFFFAAARGYALTRRAATQQPPAAWTAETGFMRSLLALSYLVRQFLQTIEFMARYLIETVRLLAIDLLQVVKAFCKEILVPTLALSFCSVLLYNLMNLTVSYVQDWTFGAIIALIATITFLFLGEMVFLGAKAPYKWRRIGVFHFELLSWLLPNLLVFFLLLSVTFAITSRAVNEDTFESLPFTIGPLTILLGAALLASVGFVFYRKRSLFQAPSESEVPLAAAPPSEAATLPAAENAGALSSGSPAQAETKKKSGMKLWPSKKKAASDKTDSKKFEGVKRIAGGAVRALHLEGAAQKAMDSAKELSERLAGKPKIVQHLAEARLAYDQKDAQLQALESTKATLAPETYKPLQEKYEQELVELAGERIRLQTELNTEYNAWREEHQDLGEEIIRQRERQTELERLRLAGAISQEDFDSQTKELSADIEKSSARHRICEQMVEILAPELPASTEPSIRRDREWV